MDMSVEMITPKQAEKYLQFNTCNRPLRKLLVTNYSNDMKNNNWRLTHQGIAFNCDGTLLDGQHRLAAVVESGVTVQMLVVRGVESRSQLVMDDHAKRSAGDALSLIRKEKITQDEISIIRGVTELGSYKSLYQRLSKHDLDQVYDTFRNALSFVIQNVQGYQRGITSAPVKSAIAVAWFYVHDLERLKTFCDILTGKILPENDGDRAAVVLREWLLRSGMKSVVNRSDGFKKTQRAIVAFNERKDIGKLFGTNTFFPWPLIDPVRT